MSKVKQSKQAQRETLKAIQCHEIQKHRYTVRLITNVRSYYYTEVDLWNIFDAKGRENPPTSREMAVRRAIDFMMQDNLRTTFEVPKLPIEPLPEAQ
jgi:hypothetical protein